MSEPARRTGEWLLVAPSYAWTDPALPGQRESRPPIQKYGTSDFAQKFVADPRDFLPFDDCDWVFRTQPSPAPTIGGRRRKLSDWKLTRTSTRKLFLQTHKRFYLVVCELHCEEPGFPNANADEVCEAGFVVRRRRVAFAEKSARDATKYLRRVVSSASELEAVAQRHQPLETSLATAGAQAVSGSRPRPRDAAQVAVVDISPELVTAVKKTQAAHRDLTRWAEDAGAVSVVEGWFPSDNPGVGSWRSVKPRPGKLAESTFPLYRLKPSETEVDHPAFGRAIWFGVVPTSSSDHDPQARARFDDRSLYEIRCFVRRHRPGCPKRLEANDCPGPLTWSAPTEVVQFAAQNDLVGTSNNPVTIQMPDIPALTAQAAAMPRAELAPVKFVTPPGSSLRFKPNGEIPTEGSLGGASVCSFSIPLITIVATFVLNIFLPIVVLIFGLFVLLRLKFCIPPSFQLSADLTTALAAVPPSVDLDVALDVQTSAALKGKLEAYLDTTLGAGAGKNAVGAFSNNALVRLVEELATTPTPTAAGAGSTGVPGSACAALEDGA